MDKDAAEIKGTEGKFPCRAALAGTRAPCASPLGYDG